MSKEAELLALAKKRQQWKVRKGHFNIAEVHGGIYECDYVSPRSKAAHNIENGVLLILQDWIDKERLDNFSEAERLELSCLGYKRDLKTNVNIDIALKDYLQDPGNGQPFTQKDIYIANVYPFIKSEPITPKDYREAEANFLKPILNVLQPRLIICAGKEAAVGVCNCLSIIGLDTPRHQVGLPYKLNHMTVVSVQHPGYRYHTFHAWEGVKEAWNAINT